MTSPADKSVPALRKLLVGGEIFLGSALSASLTKMTLRAMDLLGESSVAAKDMQISTLQILCGVAKVIEARSLTHRGAFADCLERVRFFYLLSFLSNAIKCFLMQIKAVFSTARVFFFFFFLSKSCNQIFC